MLQYEQISVQILLNFFILAIRTLYTLIWGWFIVLKASTARKFTIFVSPREYLYDEYIRTLVV